jgi:hypothetical protein
MRRLFVLLVSAVMALTLVAVAAGVSSAAPNQQQAQPRTKQFYGAADVSKAKARIYWGSGASKAAANRAAYGACSQLGGATDCVTVAWVYNGYVAKAESSKFYDMGWGHTKQRAFRAAVRNCQAGGAPPCKANWWARTPGYNPNKKTTGGYRLPGP